MSQSKADYINVIGAGLAGSEAAYQIAKRGIPVKLYEMRGVKPTPQHKTDKFAELVCSNSLRGDSLTNAVGALLYVGVNIVISFIFLLYQGFKYLPTFFYKGSMHNLCLPYITFMVYRTCRKIYIIPFFF